jgi:hypothetical protein
MKLKIAYKKEIGNIGRNRMNIRDEDLHKATWSKVWVFHKEEFKEVYIHTHYTQFFSPYPEECRDIYELDKKTFIDKGDHYTSAETLHDLKDLLYKNTERKRDNLKQQYDESKEKLNTIISAYNIKKMKNKQ